MNRNEFLAWLLEENPDRLETLGILAAGVRRGQVGDSVLMRGLIEISNHCRRNGHDSGMRSGRRGARGITEFRSAPPCGRFTIAR
jgi:hypothetical protein